MGVLRLSQTTSRRLSATRDEQIVRVLAAVELLRAMIGMMLAGRMQ
jgi:hypothetical protein